jgi:hypothetical protein
MSVDSSSLLKAKPNQNLSMHITRNNQISKMDQYDEEEDGVYATNVLNRDRIVQALVDFVIIGIVSAVLAVVYFTLEPRILYFTCNDSDIVYPKKSDTVTMLTVLLYGVLGPIAFILGIELLNSKIINIGDKSRGHPNSTTRRKNFFICIFHAISLFLLGLTITLLLTELGKC